MKNKRQIAMNGATPHERSVIISNASKENKRIGTHFSDVVSDVLNSISVSEMLKFLGRKRNRTTDVPKGEIKISPSKITVTLDKKVYEKLHYLATTLNSSKSVILHTLYFGIINGRI